MGTSRDRSDIDVGVLGPERVPVKEWLDILEAVENLRTLYTIDLVDFSLVSPEFRDIALQKTEDINVATI